MTNGYITQYPSEGYDWLYKDEGENRIFSDYVIRPADSEPWLECTNEEKEQWEAEHTPEEPIEPEL